MSGIVFLNYRRADSDSWVLRIRQHLSAQFGTKNVFHDLANIPLGAQLRPFLSAHVVNCSVMVPVIGPNWLRILRERAGTGNPDHVLIELELAIAHSKAIVPVLVDGAKLPSNRELPSGIASLADRAGLVISMSQPEADIKGLGKEIEQLIALVLSERRAADSNVAMSASGYPKLVASGHVLKKPVVTVNQAPLRAASQALALTGQRSTSETPTFSQSEPQPDDPLEPAE